MSAQSDPDVLTELRRRYDELTNSQKRIAEAIVEDPEFVAFATVDKLAGRLGVAPSTVVRFAYKIGLAGYQDLQESVRRTVRAQMRAHSGSDTDESALASHLADSGHAVSLLHDLDNFRQTIAGLQAEDLDAAVDMLADARRVYVVGGFASGSLAAYTSLALDRIRGSVHLVGTDIGRNVPALLDVGPEDALLAFGFAPYSWNSIRVIDIARAAGTRAVGITDTPVSPVGQRVEIVLTARVSGVGAQNSLVAPLGVANALLNGVMASVPSAVDRYAHITEMMDDWQLFVLSAADGANNHTER